MSWLAEFHFLRPAWLLALAPWALLLWQVRRQRRRGGAWASVCDPALRPHVLAAAGGRARRLNDWALALAALLLVVALAGPTWERRPTPVFRDPSAVVIAFDLSRSMLARDLKPTRLTRARYKIADILERRREGTTALLVFAAEPFAVTPLTDDTRTIESQLPALTPEIMPAQGSRPDLALARAVELVRQAGLRTGDVLLVTDGAPAEHLARAEEMARKIPLRVSVLGAATREGAPVPGRGGALMRDADGEVVISRLAAEGLQALAAAGGGEYRELRADDRDVAALAAFFDSQIEQAAAERTDLAASAWRDFGPWLLALGLPLAALAFRRGAVLAAVLVPLAAPPGAQALEWRDLWRTPDQRAAEALEHGKPAEAATLFEDRRWRAAARYRAGEYEAAAEALAGLEDGASVYNRGNALARLGRYEEALAAYERVAADHPAHEDARANAELIRDLLEQQQQQQAQEQEQEQQQQGDQSGEREQDGERRQQGQQGQQGRRQGDRGDPGDQRQQRRQAGQQSEQRQSQGQDSQGEQDRASQAQDQPGGEDSRAQQQDREEAARRQAEREAEAGEQQPALADTLSGEDEERQQAVEQWLRRIPDDPSGLLRRKFLYQYRQMPQRRQPEEQQW